MFYKSTTKSTKTHINYLRVSITKPPCLPFFPRLLSDSPCWILKRIFPTWSSQISNEICPGPWRKASSRRRSSRIAFCLLRSTDTRSSKWYGTNTAITTLALVVPHRPWKSASRLPQNHRLPLKRYAIPSRARGYFDKYQRRVMGWYRYDLYKTKIINNWFDSSPFVLGDGSRISWKPPSGVDRSCDCHNKR